MLEIIALIYLTTKIGMLAERKGLKKGTWKFYTVISWIGAELIVGFAAVLLLRDHFFIAILIAYAAAIGSYFVLKANLEKKPDADFHSEIEQIGTTENQN